MLCWGNTSGRVASAGTYNWTQGLAYGSTIVYDRASLHLDPGFKFVEASILHRVAQGFLTRLDAVEKEEPAAPRTKKFASPGPGSKAGFVECVDAYVGNV